MSTSVWLVSTGSYSDYKIRAVFSMKGKANDYVAHFPKADCYVEEWSLDAAPFPPHGFNAYEVSLLENGDAQRVNEAIYVGLERADASTLWRFNAQNRQERYDVFYVYCFARDEAHAIKIATEKRQEFIAARALTP